MDLGLKGKVALVTGGSKGIGFACARVLAREGARVAIAARDRAALEEAVASLRREGLEVHAESVDLRDASAIEEAVAHVEEALGPLEILVNSAGAARHASPQSKDSGRWLAAMEDKYLPCVLAMDVVVPRMASRSGGAIVNIVGMGGKVAKPTHMPGGAANAALILVSAGFAKAWGDKGVRVNVINPGAVETQRLAAQLKVKAETSGFSMDAVRAQTTNEIPLGRLGQPEDIAAVAAFLVSVPAGYLTGAGISIDGGASCLV
ncbi:SDR family NAD(P)-dependent oxidoreductase [Variovorax sp. LjRoot178]|uniref:SDR family NAD(P)-dependent oxidoreductase n=1 Tax=Variovorax sp. LjRoot178 TaxID=3342277 RepID=UPI003ED11230